MSPPPQFTLYLTQLKLSAFFIATTNRGVEKIIPYLQVLEIFSNIAISHTITISSTLHNMGCDCGAKELYALHLDWKLCWTHAY
jgi:hypothetical protein